MQQTLSFCQENSMIFNRGIVDGESDTSFTVEVCVRVLPRCFWKLSERLKIVSLQTDFFAICLRSFRTFSTTWWWICVGALRALIHWCWKNTWAFRMAKWCCMGWEEEFRMDKMLRNKDHKERLSIRSQRIDSGNYWNWSYTSANQDIQIGVLVFSSSFGMFPPRCGDAAFLALRHLAGRAWCAWGLALGTKPQLLDRALGLGCGLSGIIRPIGSTIDGCFFLGKSTQTWKI